MGQRVGLTRTQRRLFDFVECELRSGRPAPSFEEMCVHLGHNSKSSVHRLVTALVERGWLLHLPNRARSLALPGPGPVPAAPPPAAPFSVSIPTVLVDRLRAFCNACGRVPDDVVRDALDAHLEWPL